MSDKVIKVTDKRMFNADGQLREEFLEEGGEGEPESPAGVAEEPAPAAGPEPAPSGGPSPTPAEEADAPMADASAPDPGESPPRVDLPPASSAYPAPGIVDLVLMLAEPATIYLGDATLPDGTTSENLDLARLHIDLLEVLREKTLGNLSAQENAVLEDVLYRLRMRYVQKRG